MFGAKSISKLFLGSMLLIIPAGSFAYVDDAGIMDHFNYANDQCLYDYLNQNDYKFYSKDRWSDAYLKKDHSLFMTISNNPLAGLRRQSGLLYTILIMKPGYQTDKGIEVGMSLEQAIAAYGELLYSGDVDKYRNIPNTGYALEGTYTFKTKYGDQERFKYYMISYFDLDSHWVEFLVDKSSKKVKAIGYFYGDPRSGISNNRDLVYELNDWGLWPIVLADRINEHPLKSSWRAIADAWKGI